MKYSNLGVCPLIAVLALGASATSCVDNDYDLSKDIDLTINVGGDLSLPSSSTDKYTMAQILDLDANSSIKPDGALYGLADGDYVLVQSGDPTISSVSIPMQNLSETNCTGSTNSVSFVSAGAGVAVDYRLEPLVNEINISESNIAPEVKSISHAKTSIELNFAISVAATSSSLSRIDFLPGFTVEFPSYWTIELRDPAAASYMSVQGTKIVFTASHGLSNNGTLTLPLLITAVDLTALPSGQGLYAPGKFRLNDKITSSGPIRFVAGNVQAGQSATVDFAIKPSIPTAVINEVTGCVDPNIKVDATSFAINDVPDFLKEPGNNLDISNPQIHLSVNNSSPVTVSVNCRLLATDDNGDKTEVWIGSDHGTAPILINASGATDICVSRLGEGGGSGALNVAVPDLGKLIATIPQSITVDNITAKVPDNKEFTFRLGDNYDLNINYRAVVPLAFGKDLKFTYTTDEAGWDEDLSKYSFKKVVATVNVENSAPLDMVPTVQALDRNGNVINDVVATVEGTVAAGSISIPSTSILMVTLTSSAANIGNLDGVRFSFSATCPVGMTGTPLNENQSLRFTNIKLKLVGGVGVDLN